METQIQPDQRHLELDIQACLPDGGKNGLQHLDGINEKPSQIL